MAANAGFPECRHGWASQVAPGRCGLQPASNCGVTACYGDVIEADATVEEDRRICLRFVALRNRKSKQPASDCSAGNRSGSPSHVLAISSRLGEHRLEFVDEIANVLELPIDAGETDEGHLIQLPQLLHHDLADVAAGDFEFKTPLQLVLHGGDDRFELGVADGALPAGLFQAALDLRAVERFAGCRPS